MGAKSMMIDFGEDVGQCVLGTVNSSAKSVMERRWVGRIGHLHCVMPWLQERVGSWRDHRERMGKHNTADICTDAATARVLRKF